MLRTQSVYEFSFRAINYIILLKFMLNFPGNIIIIIIKARSINAHIYKRIVVKEFLWSYLKLTLDDAKES